MAVRAETEMDEVEALRQFRGVRGCATFEIAGGRHRVQLGRRGTAGRAARRCVRLRSGSPVRCHALVDLVERYLLPGHVSPASAATIAHGVRPPLSASVNRPGGDRLARSLRHDRRATPRDGLRVGQHLDAEPCQLGFSACPPNCRRMAERTRFAKSSSPRDANRA